MQIASSSRNTLEYTNENVHEKNDIAFIRRTVVGIDA